MYSLVAAGVLPPAPTTPDEEPDTPTTPSTTPSALDRKGMAYARNLYLKELDSQAQAHRAALRNAKLDKLSAVKASLTPPPSPTH